MNKKFVVLLSFALLAFVTGLPAAGPTPPRPAAAPTPKAAPTPEEHPNIRGAMKDLEHAKHLLETAARDFRGHRVKALEHVNQALRECHDALAADPD